MTRNVEAPEPNSQESEIAVLGAMMLNKRAIEKAIELLETIDFYNLRHQLIFKAICELYDLDSPIDIITLSDNLTKSGNLDIIGGRGYLAKVNKEVQTSANIEQYALIVLEKSIRRIVIDVCGVAINHMRNDEKNPFEILGLLNSLNEKIENKVSANEIKNEADLIKTAVNDIREQNSGIQKKLDFSIYNLNKIVTFLKKDMLLIPGRPSMGKTAFALTEAEYWASKGFKVLIMSMEMGAVALAMRRLSIHSGYDFKTLDKAGFELDEAESKTLKAVKGNLFIDDRSDITIYNAKARVSQAVRKYGIEIVIWDYGQLISGDKKDTKAVEMTGVSNILKRIGKELDLWNVVLLQFNRESAKGTKPIHVEPKLDQIRDSGTFEQDADIVIAPHRLAMYSQFKDMEYPNIYGESKVSVKNIGELIVLKQRNGKLAKVYCTYEGERMKWSDYKTIYELQEEGKF